MLSSSMSRTASAVIGKFVAEVLKVDVISSSMCFCFQEKQNKKYSVRDST